MNPALCGVFYVQDVLYVARGQEVRSDDLQDVLVESCSLRFRHFHHPWRSYVARRSLRPIPFRILPLLYFIQQILVR